MKPPLVLSLLSAVACADKAPPQDSAPPLDLPELEDTGPECAPEELSCDGVDDDCDGEVDEGLLTTFYEDGDGDGVGSDVSEERCPIAEAGWVQRTGDCDDTDRAISPDAVELCNEIDDDCDGVTDEELAPPSWYEDGDGDGYGDGAVAISACAQPDGHVPRDGDCDDADPAIHPRAVEVCDDAIDNDCDGVADNASVCCVATANGADPYLLCTEGGTWAEGRDRCAADGGRLAILDDAVEDAWVDDLVDWYGDHVWIGLTDQAAEGSWLTVEGTAPAYYNWASGQPNGSAGPDLDCVGVHVSWDAWFDAPCANVYAYLCEL